MDVLTQCVVYNSIKILKLLVNENLPRVNLALNVAAQIGNTNCMNILLQIKSIDVNYQQDMNSDVYVYM